MYIKNRTDLCNYLIEESNYKTYCEIGTSNPAHHFDWIRCKQKYSVDPGDDCEGWGKEKSEQFQYTHKMTSDEFFAQNTEKFDFIFIDGLHTEQQCSLDIYNALRCCKVGGMIAVHDTIPDDVKMTGNVPRPVQWQGDCWKPIWRLVNLTEGMLQVQSFYLDYGISVIKIHREIAEQEFEILRRILLANDVELTYEGDYHQTKMNIEHAAEKLLYDRVSYFSPLYKTNTVILYKVYQALCAQTVDRWEWVCYDDSPTHELWNFFEQDEIKNDPRVKYFRMNKQSGGNIGRAKYYNASFCTGTFLAELDHDDIILPEMTEYILKMGELYNADFIYTDSAEVYYDLKTDKIEGIKRYGDGFGMGYGKYYKTDVVNPINGKKYNIWSLLSRQVNPKTLRHIVGVPNHMRCWRRSFYMQILAHTRTLPIADDYELIVRTVINNGICVHINWTGYLQLIHKENATDVHRPLIQEYVKAVRTTFDNEIERYFEREDPVYGDWCRRYLRQHFGDDPRHYHVLPNFDKIHPGVDEPIYPKLIEHFLPTQK